MLMNNLDPEVAERPEELVVYGGIGRAARDWESFDRIVATLQRLGGRRDAAGPVGQAGRRVPHPRRRAARADRQLQPRAALGDLGALPRARSQGPDDVRPDDGRLVDLHRHPGHRAGHLRDLRRDGPPALRRRPRGPLDPDRGPRRHGRRAAAGGDDGRRVVPGDRVPAEPHRDAAADRLPRRAGRRPRRGAGDHRAGRAARRSRSRSACSATPPRSCRSCSRAACGPTLVTDQTSAHDPVNGYLPAGLDASSEWDEPSASSDPKQVDEGRASARWPMHVRAMLDFQRAGRADGRLRQQHPPDGARTRASPTPSTSRASCRPTSARCSAAASGRSAGPRCPAIRRTSTGPTPR